MPATIERPSAEEYAPAFERYISRVSGDIHVELQRQAAATVAFFGGLTDEQAAYRYAPGKWSLKQILGHLADTERVLGYRAVCIARGETQALPGFDEDAYASNGGFDARPLAEIVAEFAAVREATRLFFAGLDEAALARRGVANGFACSVRALAHIIVGHESHHAAVIAERYLPGLQAEI